MNKVELIKKVANITGLQKKDVEAVVEATLDTITDTLANGEKVQLVGFGNFESRQRNARAGINPKLFNELKEQGASEEEAKEKAKLTINETKVPAFKPSKKMKEYVASK
ncbi:HU family DNA-binding protein [Paenibacillus vulneris]|uniref:HU family DNA-binding protein n=1 Tax=Paenibacillus vulneris TaxID=1133364 RepID=A0ABW3UI90_9BACL